MISGEIYTHGSKEFNYAYYPHSSSRYGLFFDAHWHDEWEFIYVRDGKLQFYVDGRLFTVQKDEALLIDRYAIHAVSNREIRSGSAYHCFVFGLKFLCPDSESYIYQRCFSRFQSDSVSLTQHITGEKAYEREILRQMQYLEKYSADPRENALPIQIALLSIFDVLLRENAFTERPHSLTVQNERIKTALLYMNQEYQSPLQISSLAASLNISTDYFIRLFKAMMGLTPKQYLQNLRIQKAISSMYSDPELPISEIAQQTGFEDVNYFSRCFKKIIGLSPTQYQKNLPASRSPAAHG